MEEKIYTEIYNLIEEKEINSKVRYLKDNKETLETYWNIGRLIVEAQGGTSRAKYGDELIKNGQLNYQKNLVRIIVLEIYSYIVNFIILLQM